MNNTHTPWALGTFHGFNLQCKTKLLGLTLSVAGNTEKNKHTHTPEISSDRLDNNLVFPKAQKLRIFLNYTQKAYFYYYYQN